LSTILFVDDHHAYRTVFAEVLRNAGHTVLEAGALVDAEHLMERHAGPIDLLLAEAVLSTTNGIAIVRRLQPRNPEMKVLFVSAEGAEELEERELLPKGAHFLRKGCTADVVRSKVRELTGLRTRRAAL
jgi:two-component system cell cycle sensor histidine kinase/response regulator CckA